MNSLQKMSLYFCLSVLAYFKNKNKNWTVGGFSPKSGLSVSLAPPRIDHDD